MILPKTPTFSLKNKKALVTGASSGIGFGCAVALAEAGADVICAARSKEKLESNVNALKEVGFQARSLVVDISDIKTCEKVLEKENDIDILVNSAGIAKHEPALAVSEQNFEDVTDVNFKGAFFISKIVANNMVKNKIKGSILHISSQMGHVGGIERSVYCGTKHAVEGMVKAMAIEWGQYGIRINTICPTFIKTELTKKTFEDADKLKWIESKIKLNRIGEIEDIMGAVIFLSSDASSLITGTSLLIDGGWTAG